MGKINEIATFLNFLIDATLITDPDSNIIFANESCAKLFGYSTDEMTEMTIEQLMLSKSVKHHRHKVSHFINNKSQAKMMMSRGVMPCVDANGRRFSAKISIANIIFDNKPCAIATIHDYSSVQNLITELKSEASTDALTGLFNKRHLESLTGKEYVAINGSTYLGVANLDLNGFKAINDTYGHDIGDLLLVELSRRFKAQFRNSDLCFRLGGDEFLILFAINDPANLEYELKGFGNKIQSVITNPIYIDKIDKEVQVGVSIGIGSLPKDDDNLISLIEKTDKAMYQSKSQKLSYAIVADCIKQSDTA
ncbi:diguanylate cyclase [Vibrio sp. HN007]|uniref:diguanylate cyclase n=1 Tax=Vibrio iocasae TaxID=3098914 RepID=UPI0035D44CF7